MFCKILILKLRLDEKSLLLNRPIAVSHCDINATI